MKIPNEMITTLQLEVIGRKQAEIPRIDNPEAIFYSAVAFYHDQSLRKNKDLMNAF